MESLIKINVLFAILVVFLVERSFGRPQSEQLEELKKALYKTCSNQYPVTNEMMINAKNGIFSEDRSFKCFMMCTLKETSLIDDEGTIDGDSLNAMYPEHLKELGRKVVNTCLPSTDGKPDGCETTFNFIKCGLKVDPKTIALLPL